MDAATHDSLHPAPDGSSAGPVAAMAAAPGSALAALNAAADVLLLIGANGHVEALQIGSGTLAMHDVALWQGKHLAQTALPGSRDQISALLAGGDAPLWQHSVHSGAAGPVPMQWLALPLENGRHIAIGREQRAAASLQARLAQAQQAADRDAGRLRQLEARHRLMFDTAGEAIVIIDAASRRVLEANSAACRATGHADGALPGHNFTALVHPDDRDHAIAALAAMAASAHAQPAALRMTGGNRCTVTASLFRHDRDTRLLLRLNPLSPASAGNGHLASFGERLADGLERLPDAFVLTDDNFDIIAGNAAFLDLVGLARGDDLVGLPVGRFLGRPGMDLGLLIAGLRQHGRVRSFATMVRAAHAHGAASGEAVDVSAVSSGPADRLRHGFALRPATLAPAAASTDSLTPASLTMSQLTDRVGRMALKDIVRESTDMIERLCIEAALAYSADNRASAAEILGLSRQSLYSKLHRHGLGNLGFGTLEGAIADDGDAES